MVEPNLLLSYKDMVSSPFTYNLEEAITFSLVLFSIKHDDLISTPLSVSFQSTITFYDSCNSFNIMSAPLLNNASAS